MQSQLATARGNKTEFARKGLCSLGDSTAHLQGFGINSYVYTSQVVMQCSCMWTEAQS